MKSIKARLLIALIVYFAGFATAIYALAPVDTESQDQHKTAFSSFTKSDQFALNCSDRLRKIASLAEEAAKKTGSFIDSKISPSGDK